MPVYFIRAGEGGPIKIGKAVNVERRLSIFQTGHYEQLILLRSIPGSFREETWLHQHYSDLRISGEWFSFCDEMLTVTVPETVDAVIEISPKSVSPHSQLLDQVGALVLIAKGLGRPYPTVAAWRQRGSIPSWEWVGFIEFAKTRGVIITLEQLMNGHPAMRSIAA